MWELPRSSFRGVFLVLVLLGVHRFRVEYARETFFFVFVSGKLPFSFVSVRHIFSPLSAVVVVVRRDCAVKE